MPRKETSIVMNDHNAEDSSSQQDASVAASLAAANIVLNRNENDDSSNKNDPTSGDIVTHDDDVQTNKNIEKDNRQLAYGQVSILPPAMSSEVLKKHGGISNTTSPSASNASAPTGTPGSASIMNEKQVLSLTGGSSRQSIGLQKENHQHHPSAKEVSATSDDPACTTLATEATAATMVGVDGNGGGGLVRQTATDIRAHITPGAQRIRGVDFVGAQSSSRYNTGWTSSQFLVPTEESTNQQQQYNNNVNNRSENRSSSFVNTSQNPLNAHVVGEKNDDGEDFEQQLQRRLQQRIPLEATNVQTISEEEEDDVKNKEKHPLNNKRVVYAVSILCLCIFIAVVVGIAIGLRKRNAIKPNSSSNSNNNNNNNIDISPTPSLTVEEKLDMLRMFLSPLSGNTSLDGATVTRSSPQHKALEWLFYNDTYMLRDEKKNGTTTTLSNATVEDLNDIVARDDSSTSDVSTFTTTGSSSRAKEFVERYAIVVAYFAMGGPNYWLLQLDFLNPTTSVCKWPPPPSTTEAVTTGESFEMVVDDGSSSIVVEEYDADTTIAIRCNGNGHVEYIRLDGNNLHGIIPSELSILTSLKTLSLAGSGPGFSGNDDLGTLGGTLPKSLGTSLSRLETFSIRTNHITGTIPESYSNMKKLKYLHLADNYLTGTVPAGLYHIVDLEELYLDVNYLSGPILPKFDADDVGKGDDNNDENRNYKLLQLWMHDNLFSGEIPETLFTMYSNLVGVSMWGTYAYGEIPRTGLSSMSDLAYLDVSYCALWGPIPTEVGLLSNLQYFYADSNYLPGKIPTELANCWKLDEVYLYNNILTGQIPIELSTLRAYDLTFGLNGLSGSLEQYCDQSPSYVHIETDCAGNSPPIDCPCCSRCCDPFTAICEANVTKFCDVTKASFESDDGVFFAPGSGTVCTCSDEFGALDIFAINCVDTQCETCNKDGTICSINELHTHVYDGEGYEAAYFSTFRYVKDSLNDNDDGNNLVDTVVTFEQIFYDSEFISCDIRINGETCDICSIVKCRDNFFGYFVNCNNVEYGGGGGGTVDPCDDDPNVGGPLTVIALHDPVLRGDGCPPRLPIYG